MTARGTWDFTITRRDGSGLRSRQRHARPPRYGELIEVKDADKSVHGQIDYIHAESQQRIGHGVWRLAPKRFSAHVTSICNRNGALGRCVLRLLHADLLGPDGAALSLRGAVSALPDRAH